MSESPKSWLSEKDNISGYSVKLLGWVCWLHDVLVRQQDTYEATLFHLRSIRSLLCYRYDENSRKELFAHISQLTETDIHEIFLVPPDIFLVTLLKKFTQVRLSELRYQRHSSDLSPITEFRQFPNGSVYVKGFKTS